ncbi:MAG: YceI family protein [Lentimicrobiaceae bacterium]|nr:YceI family protein [Lentimicrobiaceae bacterium]
MATKTKWTIDPSHTEIAFQVKHLMISNVKGVFSQFNGEVLTDDVDFSTAEINFNLNPATINTGNSDRDTHLKSPDFFDVEQFDQISFHSQSMKKVADDVYLLSGDLQIKGIARSVELKVEFGGLMTDPWGNTKAGFSLSGKINRKDWGLNWNAALETGGVLVSEEVKIVSEVQLMKVS